MNWSDYINEVVGCPWVNRAMGNGEYDCYGILIDSFRRVDGVEIPIPESYLAGDNIREIGTLQLSNWVECQINDAQVVACYDSKNRMTHVGRVTPFGILHAMGSPCSTGAVALHKMRDFRQVMKNCKILAYKLK